MCTELRREGCWWLCMVLSKLMQCRSSTSKTTYIHTSVIIILQYKNINHLFVSELHLSLCWVTTYTTVTVTWCWCFSSFISSVIASFASRELTSSISRNSSSDRSTSQGEGKGKRVEQGTSKRKEECHRVHSSSVLCVADVCCPMAVTDTLHFMDMCFSFCTTSISMRDTDTCDPSPLPNPGQVYYGHNSDNFWRDPEIRAHARLKACIWVWQNKEYIIQSTCILNTLKCVQNYNPQGGRDVDDCAWF